MDKLATNVATGIKGSLIKMFKIEDMQLEHLTHPNQLMNVVVVLPTTCSQEQSQL